MTPEGWRRQPLGLLGELLKARGGTKKDQTPSGVPVIRYGELYTRHDAIIRRFYSFIPEEKASDYTPLRAGDILFAGSGETLEDIGRAAAFVGPEPAHASGDLILLRPSPGLHPEFLGYATNGPAANAQKRKVGQGSSVFHIHADELAQLTLLLPPLAEQKKIAAVLASVDDAIESSQAVIDQLGVMKKAMMAEIFDADAWPRRTVASLIAEHGGEVRTGPFGTVLRAEEQDPNGTPLISVREIRDGYIEVVADTPRVPESVVHRLPHFVLAGGDIVFARKRAVDRCAVIGAKESGSMMGSDCIRVRLPDCVDPWFCGYWFRTAEVRRHILGRSVGSTTMVTLTQGTLDSIRVPLPPMAEQRAIAKRLQSVETTVEADSATLRQLRQFKSALMSVLLTGEVRVKPDEEAA